MVGLLLFFPHCYDFRRTTGCHQSHHASEPPASILLVLFLVSRLRLAQQGTMLSNQVRSTSLPCCLMFRLKDSPCCHKVNQIGMSQRVSNPRIVWFPNGYCLPFKIPKCGLQALKSLDALHVDSERHVRLTCP